MERLRPAPSASRESAASNALPAFPARSVALRSRTSVPMVRRSPAPSPLSAHSISRPWHFVDLSHEQCGFAYRRSIFNTTQRGRYIVTAVTFRFDLTPRPHLTYADLHAHFATGRTSPRRSMSITPFARSVTAKACCIVEGEADCRSAGSFFKNPVVDSMPFSIASHQRSILRQTRFPTGLPTTARSSSPPRGCWNGRLHQRLCPGPCRNLLAPHPGAHQSRPRHRRRYHRAARHDPARRSQSLFRNRARTGAGSARALNR